MDAQVTGGGNISAGGVTSVSSPPRPGGMLVAGVAASAPLVIYRSMYGMWGPVTDPGQVALTARVVALGKEIGVHIDVGRSPYRDYDVSQIVKDFTDAPPNAVRIVCGSSLGANNCPVVAKYLPQGINIDGMFGFQASEYGAKVQLGSNIKFAHECVNPNLIMTGGLGHYEWEKAPGSRCNLYIIRNGDFHPGDTDEVVVHMFLSEMKRIILASRPKS